MKPTKDFFIECNEGGLMSPPECERTFCNQCKNRECVRADWAFTKWDRRILTQSDRLLVNPNIIAQNKSSRWDGISNFEGFQEPQVIEVWGVSEKPSDTPPLIVSEEEDTVPAQPVEPPEVEGAIETQPPQTQPQVYQNPLNTIPQEIIIGESSKPDHSKPRPKRFQSDPWTVTETLPVGGKFKMGK